MQSSSYEVTNLVPETAECRFSQPVPKIRVSPKNVELPTPAPPKRTTFPVGSTIAIPQVDYAVTVPGKYGAARRLLRRAVHGNGVDGRGALVLQPAASCELHQLFCGNPNRVLHSVLCAGIRVQHQSRAHHRVRRLRSSLDSLVDLLHRASSGHDEPPRKSTCSRKGPTVFFAPNFTPIRNIPVRSFAIFRIIVITRKQGSLYSWKNVQRLRRDCDRNGSWRRNALLYIWRKRGKKS